MIKFIFLSILIVFTLYSEEDVLESSLPKKINIIEKKPTNPPLSSEIANPQHKGKADFFGWDVSPFKINVFGFLKADYVFSNRAMLSFGRENLTAPNQAKRIVQNDDRDSRSLTSIRETTIGFKPQFGKHFSSVIQFDLVDINKGNGGAASNPRIVQAYIEYKTDNLEFFAGQKWDIFSPLYPDTYNLISGLLGSGNLGWFREQIGIKQILSKSLQIIYSVGNSNLNTNPNVTPTVELSKGPTLAFQISYIPYDSLNLYLSGIYANLKYSDPNYSAAYLNNDYTGIPVGENRIFLESKGISFGVQHTISSKLLWKGETHIGQNMDNLSLLSLGSAQVGYMGQSILQSYSTVAYTHSVMSPILKEIKPIQEIGLWTSFTYFWKEDIELIFLFGSTQILNPGNLKTSFQTNQNGDYSTREMNQNQPDVNVWTTDELGGVLKNSSIGGSIAKVFEGNWKLFFYYQYTETAYNTSSRQDGIGRWIESISENGEIIWKNNLNRFVHDAGRVPHTHLIRMGAMMIF